MGNTPNTYPPSETPKSTRRPEPKDASHRSSQRKEPDIPRRNTHASNPSKGASANSQVPSGRPHRDAMSPSERRRYNVHLDFEKDEGDETFPEWKEKPRPHPPSNKYRQNKMDSAPSESSVGEKLEEPAAKDEKSENGTDTKRKPPPTLNLSEKQNEEAWKQSGNLDKNAPETKLPETDEEGVDYPTGFLKKYRDAGNEDYYFNENGFKETNGYSTDSESDEEVIKYPDSSLHKSKGRESPLSTTRPYPLEFEFNDEFLNEYREPNINRNSPRTHRSQVRFERERNHRTFLEGRSRGNEILEFNEDTRKEPDVYWETVPASTSDVSHKGTLVLKKIETWVSDNTRAHHTKRFMLAKEGKLVVRRGQLFRLTLVFDRAFDSKKDKIRFIFQTGENPKPGNNTSVVFEIGGGETPHGWRAELYSHEGNDTTTWIQIPPTCIVSDWWFSVETSLADTQSGNRLVCDHPDPIYVLFNPWCKDDTVHFPMEHLLEEYILNPSGIIFQGSRNRILCKPWNFGQFEDGVLEACLFIIKRGFANKIGPGMSDPVKVCRIISTILSAEDNGVLVGNWFTNDYSGGRPPTSWSGSIAILSAYINSIKEETGNEPVPVKYGQCFVFSGLITTICRAIGIPCRSVTNYYSGRDNDRSQTIDFNYCVSQDGVNVKIDTSNHDFIWNFHVWNDVWMSRPDIPLPYNLPDWQALDATPQISSNGYHSCGPAPLTAIKDGATHLKFDVDFLFAEVNADILHWLRLDKSDWTVFKVETGRVGHKISTKVPDGKPLTTEQDKDHIRRFTDEQLRLIRQDITDTYKYAEGSWKEKNIMKKSVKAKRPEHKSKARDVEFTLVLQDYVTIGATFETVVKMENKSTDNRTVKSFLMFESEYYNGQEAEGIKQTFLETILKPSEASEVKLEVKGHEYLHKIRDHCFIKQIAIAQVKETDQIEAWVDDIMLDRPCLLLEPEELIKMDHNFQCRVSFKNPLPNKKLTNCTLSVEGSGIQAVELQQMKDVYHEFNTIVTLMPRRSKDIQISFTFHCRELGDITGFTTVVAEKEQME